MTDIQLRNIRYTDDANGTEYANQEQIGAPQTKVGISNPAFVGSSDDIVLRLQDHNKTSYAQAETSTDPPHYSSDPPAYSSEEIEPEGGAFVMKITEIQTWVSTTYEKHEKLGWRVFYVILILLYAAYFAYAMYYEFGSEDSIRLLWITCLVVFCCICYLIYHHLGSNIKDSTESWTWKNKASENAEKISWVAVGILYLFIVIFTLVDVTTKTKNYYNLMSGLGVILFVIIFFVTSYSPAHVRWRPVAWGLALQFIFAIMILRWKFGYEAFKWMGDRVAEFLAHTDAGSEFLFGELYTNHFFAFKVLPVVIFFSTMISVLYYLGAMQVVIKGVAYVMQTLMGTTAGESLNAAGNIFIGQSEAPLLIRPLIQRMTKSEIHAVMTGGFATIAGSVMAAYILFGVPANHLISASVMSAPAALAMAKLFWPETEKSATTSKDVQTMEKGPERNVIEAASNGASASISLVANIAVNLIAFIAILHFVDSTLTWFGQRVGVEELTFELIASYVLWPVAFLMGVNYYDCRQVARLVGVKTFINEFVAYGKLSELITNRMNYTDLVEMKNYSWDKVDDDIIIHYPNGTDFTLENGLINDRTVVISTYALCGFANVGSIGIMLGALGAMAPSRKQDITQVAVRAMIAGNVACFMTAAIAGLFYDGIPN